ncbi:adenylyltransferase/cytidyltransferase family protein [Bowmanella dokdonensis]|uniref:Adenylyltransferase/cytidyltransferase family protein n=1 Tax=Bowmanella dokdonensis TaxID=751969 RepID=A0A939DPH6_9ALTE|nr:adenylyltransferase/cytidyltransferase family protein [Bowmanella dokdonensis]MBN7826344.1 adenylyltransferase/cytidyltransferase family protein [Bowmanella dokdonensis]
MKTVITYGTFDLFHVGHVNILERLRAMGDRLIVGVSSDEFNQVKGKQSIFCYEERARIISSLRSVDMVIPEVCWQQKEHDIQKYEVSVFGIGEDWKGKFDDLKPHCEVVYLPRSPSISTTQVKRALSKLDSEKIQQIKEGLDNMLNIVRAME